jgi:hypothetical protein
MAAGGRDFQCSFGMVLAYNFIELFVGFAIELVIICFGCGLFISGL